MSSRQLTTAQHEIYASGWRSEARFRIAVCGRRFGKALDLDTPLPAPGGWLRMGDVQPGDRLFDEKGDPCRVVAVGPVLTDRPCLFVDFCDHTSVVCDADHLWPVVIEQDGQAIDRVMTAARIAGAIDAGYHVCIRTAEPITGGSALPSGVVAEPAYTLSLSQRLSALKGHLARRGQLAGCQALLPDAGGQIAHLARACGFVASQSGGLTSLRLSIDAQQRRKIVAVRYAPSREVRCIQVDSVSSLYLCGEGLVPTHNTFLIGEEIRRAARLAVARNVPIENEIWYGAPTFLQAKRVMWSRLKAIIPDDWLATRPSETGACLTMRTGHRIRLVGLDAHDNLRGAGLWFFAGDEWADVRPQAWAETIRPMLSTAAGHGLFVGTPKGYNHFYELYRRGLQGGERDHASFRFTTAQGGHVDPDELDAARRLLDERTFRQEYEASFESYSGRVLYGFCAIESVRAASVIPDADIHIGMDFNINPMTATVWQSRGNVLWQIDEIVLPTSNTDEMVSVIRQRFGRMDFDGRSGVRHIGIYPDPAGHQRRSSAGGRTDISILQEAGFQVHAMRSHPSIRDRVNVMNRLFQSGDGARHAYVDPKCHLSIAAYQNLRYMEGCSDVDKSGGHDHLADAAGYFLYAWGTRRDRPASAGMTVLGR